MLRPMQEVVAGMGVGREALVCPSAHPALPQHTNPHRCSHRLRTRQSCSQHTSPLLSHRFREAITLATLDSFEPATSGDGRLMTPPGTDAPEQGKSVPRCPVEPVPASLEGTEGSGPPRFRHSLEKRPTDQVHLGCSHALATIARALPGRNL